MILRQHLQHVTGPGPERLTRNGRDGTLAAVLSCGFELGPQLNEGLEPLMRPVNVHEAKTHVSRTIDAAQAGETILVAQDRNHCAR